MSFVLTTDWDGFVDECKRRWPDGARVFVDQLGGLVLVTAVDLDKSILVRTNVAGSVGETTTTLQGLGHSVRRGRWSTDDSGVGSGEFWVAAVAYESSGQKPGVWMDAYPVQPTLSDVQAAIVAEFVAEGTIDPMDAEDFVHRAKPNIVVLGPDDIAGFVSAKFQAAETGD